MSGGLERILVFVALAGLAFAPLEHLFGHHRGPRRDRLADLGFATVGELLVQLGMVGLVGVLLAGLDGLGPDGLLFEELGSRGLRSVLEIGTGLLVFELMGYAYHRAAHRVPALWRLHAVHHSAEHMDWLASFRQHPLETLAMTFVQNAPLVLLGIPLGSHALVLLLVRLNTVFVHADLRLPRGRWSELVATPRFHHRHHARDGAVANYASMFPWIDRAFGTHDATEAERFGLREATPRSFVGLLLLPFGRRSVS
ncbi:MAG: sterol desaturase family protein [Myxococcales bacterium]|nr:sterol desaturase family protein [Myxococcales bacterium]